MAIWEFKGRELVNCSCEYGCNCQFNALPDKGHCHAVANLAQHPIQDEKSRNAAMFFSFLKSNCDLDYNKYAIQKGTVLESFEDAVTKRDELWKFFLGKSQVQKIEEPLERLLRLGGNPSEILTRVST